MAFSSARCDSGCSLDLFSEMVACLGIFLRLPTSTPSHTGSQGIFKSGQPEKRARACVQAVTHFNDPKLLAEVSEDLGEAMVGINCDEMVTKPHLKLADTPE